MDDLGQNTQVWSDEWNKYSIEVEIRKWDYYGLRPWIVKYAPRYGNVLEAGCGLGRWVFYLSRLGVNIEGLDFSKPTIDYLNQWKTDNNFIIKFIEGDATALPYESNSLGGYISLGVVEHFIEGPHRPLQEAHRVLRPGGIAIISTPSISWLLAYRKSKTKIKKTIKKLIGRKIEEETFYQYEYRPKTLKKFVADSGLKVTNYGGIDLLYTFCELGGFTGENLKERSFAYWFSNTFEKTIVSNIGAQSITIAVKVDDDMYCFLCGEKHVKKDSLKKFDVPICKLCMKDELSFFYLKGKKPKYNLPYIMNPALTIPKDEICEFCGKEYKTDEIFEYYGFSKKVCSNCLSKEDVNIELSNCHVKPVWRNRKKMI